MNDTIKDIGFRIKELRELSDITIEEMVEYLKINKDQYITYENGTEDIPASILLEISQKLQVDMSLLLTGKESNMHIFSVTRDGKGPMSERKEAYNYENLAPKFIHKKAEPFIVTVPYTGKKPAPDHHLGQEFSYILEGSIKLYINENEIILNKGDSIYFDSTYNHAMEALNGKPAKFLAFIV